MSQEKYRYINVEEAFQKQFDGRYDKLDLYGKEPISPELENIKKLGFGKLTLAMIIAELMKGEDPSKKAIIEKHYSKDEIKHYLAFADKTVADREAHVNAHLVLRAIDDPLTSGFDEEDETDFRSVLRPR